jgi:hypothetical protein
MELKSDETRLRELFDEMTAGQPDAPPDRYSGIRRRARRHRVMKAAGALAAGAAVAALAIGIATPAAPVPPASGQRHVPGWALPWPDHRNGSVPQRVLDGAVTAWRHQSAAKNGTPMSATARAPVIWYVGQTVAYGESVAAIFEVNTRAGRRLVAGLASASQVMHGQPAWTDRSSPWVLYDVPAPRAVPGLVIGLNTRGAISRPGRNPDNWIVLLAEPQVQSATWQAPGPSSSSSSSQGVSSSFIERIGLVSAVRGLAVADTGQITGQVQLDQLNAGHRNVLPRPVTVGVPGRRASDVPQLAAPGPIAAGHSFHSVIEVTGQGTSATDVGRLHGQLAVRARCYGPGPIQLTFSFGSTRDRLGLPRGAARPKQTALGSIACDDLAHALATKIRLKPGHSVASVIIVAGRMTSYRVELGTVK